MIELTVKTLDSRNHAFSLEDDQITVRGFKEHIAESVGIAAESQRLIYCGRVLHDDKKLNDYDVNGKVIHLVFRPPPQPGQRNNDEARPPNQGQGQIHGPNLVGFAWASPGTQRLNFRHTRHAGEMPGNAVYVPVPTPVSTETVDGTDSPVVHLSNSLSSSRLIIARRMLAHVNDVLDRLDDPSRPLITSTTENNSSSSSTQAQTETEQEENHDTGSNEGTRLLQAASAAFGAAFSIAGLNNVTLLRGNGEQATDGENTSGTNDENATQSTNAQQPQQDQEGTTSNTNADSNRRTTLQLPRTPRMGELLNRMLSTQERLRPYIERYYVLMCADPILPPGDGPEGVEENQRIVDGVSSCLHYMSHACHALSDIIVDMGQQPPRNLRCRPIVIQHSAILQAGIPIQVEAHISLHGRNAAGNSGNETANDTNNGQATAESTESAQQSSSNAEESSSQERSESTTQPQTDQQNEQDQSQSAFGTVFSLPNNVEVLMEVSPENSMETGPGNEQPPNNESNNNNANTARGSGNTSDSFPWETAPPPPDFIRNLLQAVASHVVQGGVANAQGGITPVTIGGSQTIAISIDSTNTNAGQSTQARSNMGTHPTTATQTRSTPRPHHHAQHTVFHQHAHPLGWSGMNQSLDFDPFLPCNSHHVRPTPPITPNVNFAPSQPTQSNETPTSVTPNRARDETWIYFVREQADSSTILLPTIQPYRINNLLLNLIRASPSAVYTPPNYRNDIGSMMQSQSRESLRQVLSESNIRIEFLGSNMDRLNGDSTIAHVLERAGLIENIPSGTSGRAENFLADLSILLIQNVTSQDLFRLSFGLYNSLANIRRPLREFFQQCFPNVSSSELLEQATDRVLSALKPHIQISLRHIESIGRNTSNIDANATVETIFQKHIKDVLKIIFDDGFEDTRFPQEILSIANNLGTQLCAVIRYCFRLNVAEVNSIFNQFAFSLMNHSPPILRRTVLSSCFRNVQDYTLRLVQPPDYEIIPLLIHKNRPTKSSSAPSAPVPSTKETSQKQPEPEPMETEVVEERTQDTETPLEDGEEAPETFLGSAVLPPHWVPLIGRDGVRQRRQLQMQGVTNGGVTPFSDAYLGGLPSKRRKLIEQQKPRLLVSPTPNNSAITASMERLVREGVSRAGVEEIEGATNAVAADAGVRRAFGQAIRDCIHPRRYGTPDFPDPLRFPNATKYFADHEKPPK